MLLEMEPHFRISEYVTPVAVNGGLKCISMAFAKQDYQSETQSSFTAPAI